MEAGLRPELERAVANDNQSEQAARATQTYRDSVAAFDAAVQVADVARAKMHSAYEVFAAEVWNVRVGSIVQNLRDQRFVVASVEARFGFDVQRRPYVKAKRIKKDGTTSTLVNDLWRDWHLALDQPITANESERPS